LLDGAKVPKPSQLPKELEELSLRNGLDVRHVSFHNDMDKLVRSLKGQSADADARRRDEDERRRQEAEIKQRADEEERQRKAEAEKRRRDEEERRRQEAENRRRLEEAEAEKRRQAERRQQEAENKGRLDEAEAEKRRQDNERRKLEKQAAWASKKEKLHQWRGAAAGGAAVVALLLIGGIWLYRTTIPAGGTFAVVQPDPPRADKAKTAADAETQCKAEEAEQQATPVAMTHRCPQFP